MPLVVLPVVPLVAVHCRGRASGLLVCVCEGVDVVCVGGVDVVCACVGGIDVVCACLRGC